MEPALATGAAFFHTPTPQTYDQAHRLVAQRPAGIDACGENGEFHTFVYDGPMFRKAIPIVSEVYLARGHRCIRAGYSLGMLAARLRSAMANKKIDPLNKKQYGGISAMLTVSDIPAPVRFY